MADPIARDRASRGLTLLELLLALTITVMVASAIAAMLGAVSSGVGTRRDTRTIMVSASAAQSRLAAYIAPARCALSIDKGDLVLWLHDSRESGTVHATELRWLLFNNATGELTVSFVEFPAAWSQAARDLEDDEYTLGTNWMSVLADYQSKGWVVNHTLVEGLDEVTIAMDQPQAIQSRQLTYELTFDAEAGLVPVTAAGSIRVHNQPVK